VQYVFLRVGIIQRFLGNFWIILKKERIQGFLASLPFYPKSQLWEAARDFFEKKERTQGFFT